MEKICGECKHVDYDDNKFRCMCHDKNEWGFSVNEDELYEDCDQFEQRGRE